jgi:hypothetical protein
MFTAVLAVTFSHAAAGGDLATWLVFFAVVATLTDRLRNAISLPQAAQLFSPVPHAATVWRWCTKGTRGVKLESWVRGGQRVTTPEAVERFLLALNAADEPATETQDDFSRRAKSEKAALKAALG